VSYKYLASPYTHADPAIRLFRYHEVMRATAWCLCNNIYVYSPILHTHQLAIDHDLPFSHEFWEAYNRIMIDASAGVLILDIDGVYESKGVNGEYNYALRTEKRIEILRPVESRFEIAGGSGRAFVVSSRARSNNG
jgi:hypothetical protein